MRVAVVFPGQGTQAARHGRALARPPRVGDRRAGRGRARRAARARSSSTRPPSNSPAPATRSSRCCSPRSWPGKRPRPLLDDARRVRGPLARPGHRADRVGRARPRRRRAVRGAPRRAHPGRGRRPPRAAWPRCSAPRSSRPSDACTAAPDGCWLANDNAPGQVVIAGTPEGVDAAIGTGQGARRAPGDRRSTSAARSTRR